MSLLKKLLLKTDGFAVTAMYGSEQVDYIGQPVCELDGATLATVIRAVYDAGYRQGFRACGRMLTDPSEAVIEASRGNKP
jgi:hypothetical protein